MSAVTEWESPKSVKEVRSFLGLAGYYRKFIENFSKVAKPMRELLKKDKKFDWTKGCELSFQELKKRLVTAPVLCLPDLELNDPNYPHAFKIFYKIEFLYVGIMP